MTLVAGTSAESRLIGQHTEMVAPVASGPGSSAIQLVVAVLVLMAWSPCWATQGAPLGAVACGPLRPVDTELGWVDYRARTSDSASRSAVAEFDRYHTNRVADELRRGRLGRNVMDDIDYTLRHSPNHHIALQQLAQYVLAGGRPYDFPAPDCFFAWAHGFAPDDAVVLQINGNFAWKRGDLQRAGELYQQALEIDPNSAELHYNLGLYYFAGANYEKALEHAWQAYGKGYPLPGLRRKLEQAGHWRNPDPSLGATSPN